MEKVPIYGKLVIVIKDNFRMIIDMDMVKCIGGMVQVLKVNG